MTSKGQAKVTVIALHVSSITNEATAGGTTTGYNTAPDVEATGSKMYYFLLMGLDTVFN